MKELIIEIRKLITVKLLLWAFDCLPDCDFKIEFAHLLKNIYKLK